MIRSLTFILTFLFTSAASSQPLSEEGRRDITKAKDQRDAPAIARFLADRNSNITEAAAIAAGSLQDTTHIAALISLLGARHAAVRKSAAFALGQMNYVVTPQQRMSVSSALVNLLESETDIPVLAAAVEALGRTGDDSSLVKLISRVEANPNFPVRAEVALSIGRFAYRNIRGGEATRTAVNLLISLDELERWKAAYAIMRIGSPELLGPFAQTIAIGADDQDPEVRLHVMTALGKTGNRQFGLSPILRSLSGDSDWRVRVNAIKALAQLDSGVTADALAAMLSSTADPNEHVSLTALNMLGGMKLHDPGSVKKPKEVLRLVLEDASREYSARQKREAAIALAKLFPLDSYSTLSKAFEEGRLSKESLVEAFGYVQHDEAFRKLLGYASANDPRIQRSALEAIRSLISQQELGGDKRSSARASFQNALRSPDMAVITTAATALTDSTLADTASGRPLIDALEGLSSPVDVEPMVAIIGALGTLKVKSAVPVLMKMLNDSDRTVTLEAADALEKITGRAFKYAVSPHTRVGYSDYDWDTLEWLREGREVEVLTSRGSFRFLMLADEAPFTCLSFLRLIKRGFYDGLTFHRVVPNFVIQGGDPHGDGWGGPGYAIRSEFGLEHYDRGMVGVASAGKDTEGSQFFVTHSRQPHLDGRYTIFGRVTSGMDVVDVIQVGDRIIRMKFTE